MEHKLQDLEKKVSLLRVTIDKIKNWIWLKYEDEIPKEILDSVDNAQKQTPNKIRNVFQVHVQDHENVIEIKQEDVDRFLSQSNDDGFDDPGQDLDFYEPPLSLSSDFNENPPENDHFQAENMEQNFALAINSDPEEICQMNQSQSLINDCFKKRLVISLEKLEVANPTMFNQSNENSARSSQIRLRFTQKQLKLLKEFYDLDAKPDSEAIDKISKQLNMPNEKIFNWFQSTRVNKCSKSKRKPGRSKPKEGKRKSGQRTVWESPKLLTPLQKEVLNSCLEENPYPSPDTIDKLMKKTNLSKHTLQIWFQNRRTERNKLQKSAPSKKETFKCEKCSFTTHLYKYLFYHCHEEHQIRIPYFKFSCPVCLHGYTSKRGYQKHLKDNPLHNKDPNFQSIPPLHERKRHRQDIKDNNPSICETCGRNFPHSRYLKNHITRVHGINGVRIRKFNCTFPGCNAGFYTSGHATKHLGTHSDPEVKKAMYDSMRMACVTCGKMVFKSSMNRHLLLHDKDRQSFSCDIGNCQKKFAFKYILWEHYRVHMNVSRKEYSEEFTKNCSQEILDFLEKRKKSVKKYAVKYNARQKELKKT